MTSWQENQEQIRVAALDAAARTAQALALMGHDVPTQSTSAYVLRTAAMFEEYIGHGAKHEDTGSNS